MRYTQLFETKLGGFTVKPLHIEQGAMDEADLNRRGFLRGLGAAAAVAGAAGSANADWKQDTDNITGQPADSFSNDSIDKQTTLIYDRGSMPPFSLRNNKGKWEPSDKWSYGRIQVDNGPIIPIAFQATNNLKYMPIFAQEKDLTNSKNIWGYIQSAKQRITIDAYSIGPNVGTAGLLKFTAFPPTKESVNQGVAEAIKLDAPQKSWSQQDMQDYLTRIKTGTKTKQDRFKPIIHGSNVKAITKDDGTEEWDLEDLKRQITTPPRAILGSNAKMSKSKKEGAITYDLTLPALSGIVVDEETGEFVEITTCPGAGECQLFCYARKGGYVMFPAASMSAAQALNFLVNHPDEYMQMFDAEIKRTKALADKNGIKLLVRIHDAGDFFSKQYWELSKKVQLNNPDVRFYFYSKMGDPVTDPNTPANTLPNFSDGGAKSREVKKVEFHRNAGKNLKGAPTIPKDMFRNLFVTDAKGKYVKDEQGRTQVRSAEAWDEFKQQLSAKYRIDPASIITYDQMNRIPEGPKPQWNVVVFPAGHGDLGATRLDVQNQFLMFH
jgi:hypothetical protein